MPDTIPPSLLAFDDEHHRVLYVEGRVVGWTGTRAQYAWQIMSAPFLGREQILFLEAEPLTEYEPYPYRGDALTALRRHAVAHRLEIMDCTDVAQQGEIRYSEALEQEIHELQAQCRQTRIARRTRDLLARLEAYETACTQLHDLLAEHFAAQSADWERVQSILKCCRTDAPDIM
jgi:hypothetical protein